MTHALFLNDIGISHKTTTQNENVYLKGAQGLYLPVNVNNFANEVSVSKLFVVLFLHANKRRSAPGWQLTDRNVGARGECLERPQKIIKRELVDLLFKYVSRDVWWLCEKSAVPTKSWRFVKNHCWENN